MTKSGRGLLELSFDLGLMDPEAAETACFECGAWSVTYADAHDGPGGGVPVLEPLPGEFRLWPATRLKALFGGVAESNELPTMLAARLGLAPDLIRIQRVAERIWEREWLRDFHAMRFGARLWVCPHHERVSAPGAAVVYMAPGLAFGTGTHPTTALCLEWLDGNLEPGATVIDYGCGSGVLALAAAKLGAASVHCFDIDPQALLAARGNAETNGLAARVQVHDRAESLPQGVDTVVANILSDPLCKLAPRFASLARPGGAVVLAGLLKEQEHEVTRAYGACFDMALFGEREGWLGLAGRRR